MDTIFNPNELVLEKIRTVEEFDPETNELIGRYTQIEDPSLQTGAEQTDVTDAMGDVIASFYRAKTGTFSFTNSLFSLDLAASQFGTTKKVASDTNKITIPISETLTIGSGGEVNLKYIPVGVEGAEIKYVKVINKDNTFGKTYEVGATAEDGKFTIDATEKKITLPADVEGRVFVNYERESTKAVQVTNSTNNVPQVKTLLIHAIFHPVCNTNLVIAGVIRCPRAQIDPSSVDITLTPDGKHSASYILQKEYCSEEGNLFDIIVSQD